MKVIYKLTQKEVSIPVMADYNAMCTFCESEGKHTEAIWLIEIYDEKLGLARVNSCDQCFKDKFDVENSE